MNKSMHNMGIKRIIKNITFFSAINSIYRNYFEITRGKFGFIHPTAFYRQPLLVKGIENVELYENTSILGHSIILSTNAKFVMKKYSGAAEGLTVVTGNHSFLCGKWFRDITDDLKNQDEDKDVVVEEDVWIASNVTILAGVTIGRGAIVGAGSVIRSNVPPYAIVLGNPAKVVGFRFNPEEIIEHEKNLYLEKERLSFDLLLRNYNKFFINRVKEIKEFTRIY